MSGFELACLGGDERRRNRGIEEVVDIRHLRQFNGGWIHFLEEELEGMIGGK